MFVQSTFINLFDIIMKGQKTAQLTDTQFFAKIAQELKQVCQSSLEQQAIAKQIKKNTLLKEENSKRKQVIGPSKYVKNLLVDYFRANSLNYTYSVFLKENDILSSEVIPKSDLIDFFSLSSFYTGENFRVSCIELILSKLSTFEAERKEMGEMGIQVQLLKNDNKANNSLLNEIYFANIRKQIQDREKKHYQQLLLSSKKSMSMTMKEDAKKQFETKMKEMKAQYEKQVNNLKEKNKQFLINNPKMNPKIEQYLKKIEELEQSNMNIHLKLKDLQKQKISHNCFKTPKIIARQAQLQEIKSQLTKKKQQYEFALSNLHTSVHNVAHSHNKVFQPSKQTDKFINELKLRKNTKEFMIDEMHGRMLIMDRRIESLSNENTNLRQQNRQLASKIIQLQQFNKGKTKQTNVQAKENKFSNPFVARPKTKNVAVGVRPEDIQQSFKQKKKENVIDESESNQNSDEQSETINKKAAMKLQVNRIHTQMQISKNKLRFLVQDFQ